MPQSTWAADTNTWDSTPYNWANSTYQESVVMTQTILNQLNGEDTIFPRSLSIGASYGMVGTSAQVMPASALLLNNTEVATANTLTVPLSGTITGTSSIINNVNYPETALLDVDNTVLLSSKFLWDEVTEDTGSTWSETTGAGSLWTTITEDTVTTWTPEDK